MSALSHPETSSGERSNAETNVLSFLGVRSQGTSRSRLTLDMELGPGAHVLLGEDADGPLQVLSLACGLVAPARGQVRIGNADPYATPQLRARIGSVLEVETLPPGKTVAASVQRLLKAHGSALSPADCLDRFGLIALLAQAPLSLRPNEFRGVATAVALSLEHPRLLALQAPLKNNAANPAQVAETLRQRAAECPVLVVSNDPLDCTLLLANGYLFSAGRWIRTFPVQAAPDGAPHGGPLSRAGFPSGSDSLLVYTFNPAALATELSPLATRAGWSLHCDARGLTLSGGPLVELSRAVLSASGAAGVSIEALDCTAPSLQAVRSAIDGYAQGVQAAAYYRSYYGSSPAQAIAAEQAVDPAEPEHLSATRTPDP